MCFNNNTSSVKILYLGHLNVFLVYLKSHFMCYKYYHFCNDFPINWFSQNKDFIFKLL